ncbi:MAG: SurA N-terminal domain-containing protein [Anaerolineales bacterium]|jgi:peptidyl-prolyl cis-trans isomerase C
MSRLVFYITALLAVALFLTACKSATQTPPNDISPTVSVAPTNLTSSPTPFQPSPTPQPLAVQVNGTGISMQDYQAELARYQASTGTQLATEDKQRVLNDLIDQTLLAQGAAEKGFTVDESTLNQRISDLTQRLGGEGALSSWMAANGYVTETFRTDLSRSIAAAWMRDQISASVPKSADQVHARQILVFDSDQAQQVMDQLNGGASFDQLAAQYDPVKEGDLGWFPRGYLPDAALDEAAFSLQPKQYSQIIQTQAGYCILEVIDRQADRPLEPEARLVLQNQALQKWLQDRRGQSNIQVLLP